MTLRIIVVAFLVSRVAAADALDGHWAGMLERGSAKLDVSFDFGPGPTGRYTSATQRAMDYPLDEVRVTGATVHVVLGGEIVFDGSMHGDAITGRVHDSDGDSTFVLHRVTAPKLPYDLSDVTFGDVKLTGMIASPRTPGRHPAVVLLHGSGPESRWGTNRFIADQFARAGIVALIYDKRGSGASGGDWKTATYDDLARDALAGIAVLAHRPDVDPTRIGVHGHSQGGIVAALVARLAPTPLAFIVAEDTVAGPVWKQDLYRVEHALADEFKPDEARAAMALYTLFVEVARGVKPYAELERASAPVANQAWYRWLALPPRDSWLWNAYPKTGNVDTLAYWRDVRVPTLLVYGERDKLVPVGDSIAAIEGALTLHGAPVAAWIAPRAEHNLTVHPQHGEPFFFWHAAPGIINSVAAWIRLVTG